VWPFLRDIAASAIRFAFGEVRPFDRPHHVQEAERVTDALPRTEAEVLALAADQGFAIPQACLPGVVSNMALLQRHADTLLAPAETPKA